MVSSVGWSSTLRLRRSRSSVSNSSSAVGSRSESTDVGTVSAVGSRSGAAGLAERGVASSSPKSGVVRGRRLDHGVFADGLGVDSRIGVGRRPRGASSAAATPPRRSPRSARAARDPCCPDPRPGCGGSVASSSRLPATSSRLRARSAISVSIPSVRSAAASSARSRLRPPRGSSAWRARRPRPWIGRRPRRRHP